MKGSVDVDVAEWMVEHRHARLTEACRFLEDLGTSPLFFVLLIVVALVVIGVLRAWSGLPSVLVALGLAAVVTGPLKEAFDRPRPPPELSLTTLSESAMPSSHALITASVTVAVLMAPWWRSALAQRVVAALAVAGCLVVAAAMVYLGGHWLTDVLVGWAVGAGLAAGVMLAWRRLPLPGGRRAVRAAGGQ
ncbi:MAG: hypothetical protein JWP31_2213 [Aeromicrobium sp.]|nr:hypothetical protein [Aeromicrobium sp.]